MPSLFSFAGRMPRLPYALWSLAIFFSQPLVILAILLAWGERLPTTDWWLYLAPFQMAARLDQISNTAAILLLAYLLAAAWALAALAFRRARDADIINDWIAALVIAPVVQIPAILALCVPPSRDLHERQTDRRADTAPIWPAATQGMIAGVALTLFAVAIGALVFRVYGFGLFVLSPFVIGGMTAYLANRSGDLGGAQTAAVVTGATALGGIALIVIALEGLLCIIMAAPLGLGMALIGGLFGRAVAAGTRRPTTQTLSGFAVLPLVFAVEYVFPASTSFDTYQTISVNAPPAAVWKAIVRMEPIDEPPALPFHLGIAYPLGGEIIGEGVGAIRRGEFSTGTALERITEWIPNQKLAFVVTSDVPAMRELSPYEHVHAPHVAGYFRTTHTSFELAPRPDGGTDVVERGSHELKLDPVLYWLPMARWVVHQNNARVLAHIRRQAERSAAAGD